MANIFLDLDGTLIDSTARLYQLFIDIVSTAKISSCEYRQLKRSGQSNQLILSQCLGYSNSQIEEFISRWMAEIENAFYLKLDKKFEFADSALETLSKQHTIFIVTARQDVLAAEKQIEQFGFTRYIQRSFITRQQITKSDLIQNSKIILNRDDVFVGDTGVDIQSAQALGVTSVAVLSGSRNRASLEKYKPDFIYRDLNEFVLDFKINIH